MSPRMRMFALVAVAGGLWLARDLIVPADPAVARRVAARPRATAVPDISGEVCTTPAELPSRGRFAVTFDVDPFTARAREVAAKKVVAPPPPPPVVVAPAGPPAPPPPPPPPRLPYRYMGMVNDPGAPASVFLILGTTMITAHPGETLEGGFRLDSVSPREIVFQHPLHKQAVRLAVDGETP
jgi:hypothetical protein